MSCRALRPMVSSGNSGRSRGVQTDRTAASDPPTGRASRTNKHGQLPCRRQRESRGMPPTPWSGMSPARYRPVSATADSQDAGPGVRPVGILRFCPSGTIATGACPGSCRTLPGRAARSPPPRARQASSPDDEVLEGDNGPVPRLLPDGPHDPESCPGQTPKRPVGKVPNNRGPRRRRRQLGRTPARPTRSGLRHPIIRPRGGRGPVRQRR